MALRTEIITVNGMTCDHCKMTVTRAVKEVEGVSDVRVDLERKEVEVVFDPGKADLGDIREAITGVGYEVA